MLQTAVVPPSKAGDEHTFSDIQLLGLIACNENWALSELYNRHARLVFSIAVRILNDPASAEEIVQQVFMQVWKHACQYRMERGRFSAWLGAITRNLCMDEFRRRRVQPRTALEDWEAIDELADDHGPAQDPLDQISIREALQQIPAQQRVVIELAFWDGMTHREIALHCHSSLGTVKTRLRLGKMRLRLLLQGSI